MLNYLVVNFIASAVRISNLASARLTTVSSQNSVVKTFIIHFIIHVDVCSWGQVVCLFVFGATAPSGRWPPLSRGF